MSENDMRRAFEQAMVTPDTTRNLSEEQWTRRLSNPWVQSFLGGIVTIIFLFLLNPPMTQSRDKDHQLESKPSVGKVLAWGLVTSILILVVPVAIKKLSH
jgi:hypothetical protein